MSGFAGRLRDRVTIERQDAGRDALGGANGGWSEVRSAWAAVVPGQTGAPVRAGARDALPNWLVTIRAEGAVPMLGDHVLWKGRRLRVRLIGEDQRRPDRLVLGTEEQR